MGNSISSSAQMREVARDMAIRIIGILTTDVNGLNIFKSNKQLNPLRYNHIRWQPSRIYNDGLNFEMTIQYLTDPIKQAAVNTKLDLMNTTDSIKNFIAYSIANEIICSLLKRTDVIERLPNIKFKKNAPDVRYQLPKYDQNQIVDFCKKLTEFEGYPSISIDTINSDEKTVLSNKLANTILQTVSAMNITNIVDNCLTQSQRERHVSIFTPANDAIDRTPEIQSNFYCFPG